MVIVVVVIVMDIMVIVVVVVNVVVVMCLGNFLLSTHPSIGARSEEGDGNEGQSTAKSLAVVIS